MQTWQEEQGFCGIYNIHVESKCVTVGLPVAGSIRSWAEFSRSLARASVGLGFPRVVPLIITH